ncbi:MAG: laccase domain-containing protein, partial [Lachnospiraceae bacterium]|nr:laccase domain-containing protein [Lachnospiraceae bacterium]
MKSTGHMEDHMEYFSFKNIDSTGIARAIYTPKGLGNWSIGDPGALANFTLLGKEFGISPETMVRTDQKHTADVRVITAAEAGEGVVRPVTRMECDGIMTDVPGIMLCTVEADCTPVYLLDPVRRAAAMIHSGWRGTASKITDNAIRMMEETYGTDPAD